MTSIQSAAAPVAQRTPFPQSQFRIVVWKDPLVERLGHEPRSIYVEQYWLALLGPSATLLLRRLARDLERMPEGYEITTLDLSREIGLGTKGGRHSPFWRSVERICRFGGARRHHDLLEVRRKLPPLTVRQAQQLPPALRAAHQLWLHHQLEHHGSQAEGVDTSTPLDHAPVVPPRLRPITPAAPSQIAS